MGNEMLCPCTNNNEPKKDDEQPKIYIPLTGKDLDYTFQYGDIKTYLVPHSKADDFFQTRSLFQVSSLKLPYNIYYNKLYMTRYSSDSILVILHYLEETNEPDYNSRLYERLSTRKDFNFGYKIDCITFDSFTNKSTPEDKIKSLLFSLLSHSSRNYVFVGIVNYPSSMCNDYKILYKLKHSLNEYEYDIQYINESDFNIDVLSYHLQDNSEKELVSIMIDPSNEKSRKDIYCIYRKHKSYLNENQTYRKIFNYTIIDLSSKKNQSLDHITKKINDIKNDDNFNISCIVTYNETTYLVLYSIDEEEVNM